MQALPNEALGRTFSDAAILKTVKRTRQCVVSWVCPQAK